MIEIKEYKTICDSDLEVFDRDISVLLKLGWTLHGSPYLFTEGDWSYHCQALTNTRESAGEA